VCIQRKAGGIGQGDGHRAQEAQMHRLLGLAAHQILCIAQIDFIVLVIGCNETIGAADLRGPSYNPTCFHLLIIIIHYKNRTGEWSVSEEGQCHHRQKDVKWICCCIS